MPATVPTQFEYETRILSLESRVSALEGVTPPPDPPPTDVPPVGSDVVIGDAGITTVSADWDVNNIDLRGTLALDPSKSVKVRFRSMTGPGKLESKPATAAQVHQFIFADVPDTELNVGIVDVLGTAKTPFVRLADEPLTGQSTLTLSAPVIGWQPGDRLVLPDTRHLIDGEKWGAFKPQWETVKIKGVSGTTVTLETPLKFDHRGTFDGRMPHVGNLSRNVQFKSENASGNRGYCRFAGQTDVRYAQFSALGRTTTDDSDFYPVFFDALAAGTFIGNSISCPLDPMPYRWGIAAEKCSDVQIADNVVYNWYGAGIALEGCDDVTVERNFIVGIRGNTGPRNADGLDGTGIWADNFWNTIRDNVVASCVSTEQGIVTGCGYQMVCGPGQPARHPLREFARNEAYGCMATGCSFWHLGTDGTNPNGIGQSVVKDFTAWHCYGEGFYGYPIQNVLFDGFIVRGDPRAIPQGSGCGWRSGDYFAGDVTIQRADIQGMNYGVWDCTYCPGTFTIRDSFFSNAGPNIGKFTISTPGGGDWPKPAQVMRIEKVTHGSPETISMLYVPRAKSDFNALDEVFVVNHNGVQGDNFQVYYLEQAPGSETPVAGAVSPTSETRAGVNGFARTM